MADFTEEQLLDIVAAGESDRVEFKESLLGDAPVRIRQAICAFANDLPGHEEPGLVLVGVRDDGAIGDLSVTDQLLRQLADMKTDGNIVPPPSLTVHKYALQGKEVAVVAVQPSNSPPVRYKGTIYTRIGSRQGIATPQEERILNEKRRHKDIPFDIHPVPTAGVSDLNLTRFENEYLPRAFSNEVLAANDRSTEEQLAATKMIAAADQSTPTVLGILAIGKNPQDFLPGAYVQFLRINGNELTDEIVDAKEIRGAIPELLRDLEEKMAAHNRTAVDITTHYLEKRTESYPMAALQQITRNAVMHRAYEATNVPIHVYWFNDRIEVTNPGGAFGAVTSERFGEPGLVDYRNPNLADAMKTLGHVQRFGVGIAIATRLLVEAGHPEPEFNVSDSVVSVTIRSRKNPEETER